MRAQKNRTVDYLDREAPDRDALIQFAITRGRKRRQLRRVKQRDIQAELSSVHRNQAAGKRDKRPQESGKLLKTTSIEEVSDIYHLEPTKRPVRYFAGQHPWTEHLPRMDERRRKSGIQREE